VVHFLHIPYKNTVYLYIVLVQLPVTLSIFLILSFSVIALTLYKDTDLLALPYPQVTVIF